jgi:hypothetical protein
MADMNNMPGIYSGYYPPGFEEYNTQYGGRLERVGAKLWDTQTFTSASTVSLVQFFNVRATPDLSNMETAFQLPAPKAFLIRAIRMFVKLRPLATTATPGSAFASNFDNIAQLINTGVMTFTVGNKQYAQEPLWALTAGGGAFGSLAGVGGALQSVGIDYAQNGVPDPRAVNTLSVPLFLAPQINFNARIDWAAALTLSSSPAITLCLDGDLLRPVQ